MLQRDESIYLGPPRNYEDPYAPLLPIKPLNEETLQKLPWQRNYLGMLAEIHRCPFWLSSRLLCGLCGLIPIVGYIAELGYTMAHVESLHRSHGQRFERFNFEEFSNYIVRGVGPFLILLLASIAIWIFNVAIDWWMGWGFYPESYLQPNQPMDLEAFAYDLGTNLVRDGAITYPAQFALQPLVFALALRGGLSQNVGESFSLGAALRFCRLTLADCCFATLIYVAVSVPLFILRVAACGIGLIPVSGYLTFVNGWLSFQVYRVYLSRGGTPIPLKHEPLMAELA